MSETSPMALMSPINNIVLGSCGVPVPNSEFKIGITIQKKTKHNFMFFIYFIWKFFYLIEILNAICWPTFSPQKKKLHIHR